MANTDEAPLAWFVIPCLTKRGGVSPVFSYQAIVSSFADAAEDVREVVLVQVDGEQGRGPGGIRVDDVLRERVAGALVPGDRVVVL